MAYVWRSMLNFYISNRKIYFQTLLYKNSKANSDWARQHEPFELVDVEVRLGGAMPERLGSFLVYNEIQPYSKSVHLQILGTDSFTRWLVPGRKRAMF